MLVYEVIVGLQANTEVNEYVGARVRSRWATGSGWLLPLEVDVVQGAPDVPLGIASLGDVKPLDLWRTSGIHELQAELVDGILTASFDGVVGVSQAVPVFGRTRPLLVARVYSMVAGVITPRPVFWGIQLQTLHPSQRVGPSPDIPGDIRSFESPILPVIHLPLGDLETKGFFKRMGSRSWQATQDVETNINGTRRYWPQGTVVRAMEKYVRQEMVPVIPDYRYIRGKRMKS
jgi:hypothetical protein